MIYTLTFNPAIDYVVNTPTFSRGTLSRSLGESFHIGGKGINVSLVLKNLEIESTALGFVCGFTGEVIKNTLKDLEIPHDFVELSDGFSRINVKIKSAAETEINGLGPHISDEDMGMLYKKLDRLQNGDTLVLAGSVPSSLPSTIYCDILERLLDKDLRIVVDATNELLTGILKFQPFLIKPNHFELSEIFGKKLTDDEEIAECAKNLKSRGAKNVLVSMGGRGALMVTEDDRILRLPAPEGEVINTTGSGDSMVAGFLAGYLEEGNIDHAFALSLAAGSAGAFSHNLATKEEILNIYNKTAAI